MTYSKSVIFISVATILAFTGCVGMLKTANYDIGMEEVERPSNSNERYADAEIIKQDSADISKYVYADSLISITWIPTASKFGFQLENKSEFSMKIIWDEAVFVNSNGESMRVMHSGVKYIDRNSPQPPTVIVRGGKVSDIIIPTDNVYYVSGQYGGWREKGIFEPYSEFSIEKLKPAKNHIGKKVQVLLPLDIKGTVNEYIFTFKVNDVELPQQ